jgi:hypothetical protein
MQPLFGKTRSKYFLLGSNLSGGVEVVIYDFLWMVLILPLTLGLEKLLIKN